MENTLNMQSQFSKIFIPILLSFITHRLILQTDLIMVSSLGSIETAAFAIPSKIMIIDMIIAMAFAPTLGIMIAKIEDSKEKNKLFTQSITILLIISLILTLIGFIFYPYLVNIISPDENIRNLSKDALWFLTLSIPARFITFCISMCLYSWGINVQLIVINLSMFVLNFILNWILMFNLQLGFSGCYLATFTTTLIGSICVLLLARRYIEIGILFTLPNKKWLMQLLKNSCAEGTRVSSVFLIDFLLVFIVAHHPNSPVMLPAFAVVSEFNSLAFVPFIALMRSTGLYIARDPYHVRFLPHLFGYGLLVSVAIGIFVAYEGTNIGVEFYHLKETSLFWWTSYVLIFLFSTPIQLIASLQKGIIQAKEKFIKLSIIESSILWFVFLPIFYFGIQNESPWLTWSSYLVSSLLIVVSLFIFKKTHHTPKPSINSSAR